MRDDADELPDVAVGRIIGNDQAAVRTAVKRSCDVRERPAGRPVAAARDDRRAVPGRQPRRPREPHVHPFAETVRNGLVGQGVAVDRIYDDSPDATPTQFNDGTALPAALQKPTFAWDGDGADVSAAWNEGRFLVIHRDHGWRTAGAIPGSRPPTSRR